MNELAIQENGVNHPPIQPGTRFSLYEVVKFVHVNKNRCRCYLCRCDCGTEKIVNGNDLKSGRVRSCGCLGKDTLRETNSGKNNKRYVHGGRKTKLYRLWHGIHERCSDPKHISYPWYGAKGVCVCEEWNDFQVFRNWALQNGYKEGLSIDRKSNQNNYSPDNCTWITKAENTAKGNRERGKV